MYKRWKFWLGATVVVVLIIAISVIVYQAANPPPSLTAAGSLTGRVGDTLKLTNGLEITLLAVEKHNSEWLFHFHVFNHGQDDAQLIGNDVDHQFYVDVQGSPFKRASSIPAGERAKYPLLPTTLSANSLADGWIMIDTASTGRPDPEILYAFAAVPDTICANPQNQNTCQPDYVYKTLTWNFQAP